MALNKQPSNEKRNLPAKQRPSTVAVCRIVCEMNADEHDSIMYDTIDTQTGSRVGFFCERHAKYMLRLARQGVKFHPDVFMEMRPLVEWKTSI